MPRVAVLTIGDELTSGRVVDRNASTLATRLRDAGIETPIHLTCGDDEDVIVRWLRTAHEAADVVVTTGGLGPTDDDVTHAAVARWAGVELELHDDVLETIRHRFTDRGIVMPEPNRRQAMLPAGATVVPNPLGTAPGVVLEREGKWVVTLPGVPRELAPMLEETVVPFLRTHFRIESVVKVRILKTFGFTESRLAEILAGVSVPAHGGLRIGYRPIFPEIHLSLTASAADEATAVAWISEYEERVRPLLGHRLWGVDDDELAGVVLDGLRRGGLRLATAESCTGGLVGKLLTDVAGSSDVYERGFITYTNEAKQDLLGVPPDLFAPGGAGAVSEACACAMALGARERSAADVAVSVTGVAGPSGGTADKPVGTVWIGVSTRDGTSARMHFYPGPRSWVRTLSAYTAIDSIRRVVLQLPDLDPLARPPRR